MEAAQSKEGPMNTIPFANQSSMDNTSEFLTTPMKLAEHCIRRLDDSEGAKRGARLGELGSKQAIAAKAQ